MGRSILLTLVFVYDFSMVLALVMDLLLGSVRKRFDYLYRIKSSFIMEV